MVYENNLCAFILKNETQQLKFKKYCSFGNKI